MSEIEDDIAAAAYFGERHKWDMAEMTAAFPEFQAMYDLQKAINAADKYNHNSHLGLNIPRTDAATEAIVQFRMEHPEIL